MRKCLIPLLLLSLSANALTPAGKARVQSLEAKTLPELKLPPLQRFDAPNGWHVILIEDHSLPLVEAKMIFRASTVFVPHDKVGTAGILTRLIRGGGTTATAPDKLDQELDRMAINMHDAMSSV